MRYKSNRAIIYFSKLVQAVSTIVDLIMKKTAIEVVSPFQTRIMLRYSVLIRGIIKRLAIPYEIFFVCIIY